MKKYLTYSVLACVLCLLSTFISACSCSNIEVSEVYFSNSSIEVVVGDSITCTPEALGLRVLPSNAKDTSVSFVITQDGSTKVIDDSNKPTLIAINEGVATITAKSVTGKTASITVRVYEKNYTLSTPTGITIDNSTQCVTWDKQFIEIGKHSIDEVFYVVMLNGTVVDTSHSNQFYNFKPGQWNTIKVKSTVANSSTVVGDSEYSGEVRFYVLDSPKNVGLENGKIVWEPVNNADSYKVIVYTVDSENKLQYHSERANIRTCSYNLNISEAGKFAVEVRAVPSAGSADMYTSRGSNRVSVTKYSEVQTLNLENDVLKWNAVLGAEEYNVVLRDMKTNTSQKINVKATSGEEQVCLDLSQTDLVGTYVAKIEVVSNPTSGINSSISTASIEFTKLDKPNILGVYDNTLKWDGVLDGMEVNIMLDEQFEGAFVDGYTLPSSLQAGNYKIYMQAIGNGSNIVSSSWFTEDDAYTAIKLAAPTTMYNVGYDMTVGKVVGATSYSFIDVYDKNGVTPANITITNISQTATEYTATIDVRNKVHDWNRLSDNKFEIKAKSIGGEGSNYFDSDYSEASITFIKLLQISNVDMYTVGSSIQFSYLGEMPSLNNIYVSTYYPETYEIVNSLLKVDTNNIEYYDIYLQVFRQVPNSWDEEIFQRAISLNSQNLQMTELFDTKGGDLTFKISYYGNNTTILHGDGIVALGLDGNVFMLKKAYEPENVVVNGTAVTWDVAYKEIGDVFYLKNKTDDIELGNTGFNEYGFNLNDVVTEVGKTYEISITNVIGNRNNSTMIYWSNSRETTIEVQRLQSPTINFNGDYIEWELVENAKEYWVVVNGEYANIQPFKPENAVDNRLKFNYPELFGAGDSEKRINIVASMGQNSDKLFIDSYLSNSLTVRNLGLSKVEVENYNIYLTPTFDLDVSVFVKLFRLDSPENYLFSGEVIEKDVERGAFVFNPTKYLNGAGQYSISFVCAYNGLQTEQMRYVVQKEFTINNLFTVLASRIGNYQTKLDGDSAITWAKDILAKGYKIVVRQVGGTDGAEFMYFTVDANVSEFNLINITGVKTNNRYEIAVVSIGGGNYSDLDGNMYQIVPDYTGSNITLTGDVVAYFDSIPIYLTSYKNSSASFRKVGDIQNFASSISGDTVILTWLAEAGISYDVYKDDVLIASTVEGTYSYTLDRANEYSVTLKVRGKHVTNSAVIEPSAFTDAITIEVLSSITNLKAEGVITFEHEKDDCSYEVIVIDQTLDNSVVYTGVYDKKSIDLASISEIVAGHLYTIKVRALSNATNYFSSAYETITDVSKSASATIYMDADNRTFLCSGATTDYVVFYAEQIEDDKVVQTIKSNIMLASDASFNLSEVATGGKYRVWVVCVVSDSLQNELYSTESNSLYVEVLPRITDIKLTNGKLQFMPIENHEYYIIKINGVEKTINVQDTFNIYTYQGNEFDTAGVYDVQIAAKGNYQDASSNVYASSINSMLSENIQIVKLQSVTNLQLSSGILSWDAVENAQGYEITFTKAYQADLVYVVQEQMLNLYTTEISAGTYSYKVRVLGSDEKFFINSAVVAGEKNINLASTEQLAIYLDANKRIIEWDGIAVDYGYKVTFVNEAGEKISFTTNDDNFAVPTSLDSGMYVVYVQVEGNGTNILTGVESNRINVIKLESATNVGKLQNIEQDENSVACISFDKVGDVVNYLIKITRPDGIVDSVNYVYDEFNLYEYTFEQAGEYKISVTTLGNYDTTIDSNPAEITIIKMPKLQDFSFSYEAKALNQIVLQSISTWATYGEGQELNYSILIVDPTCNNVITLTKDNVDYALDILPELIKTNREQIKVRVQIPLDNPTYLSSDWVAVDIKSFKKITITGVSSGLLKFTFDQEEKSEDIAKVTSVGVNVINANTSENVASIISPFSLITATEQNVDLSPLIQSLSAGEYFLTACLIGNGNTFLASNMSEQYFITKLSTPTISVTGSQSSAGENIAYLTWERVEGAVKYVIIENGVSVGEVTDLKYNLDERFASNSTYEKVSYCVYAVGALGTMQSANSEIIYVSPAQNGLIYDVQRGTLDVGNYLEYENYNVQIKVDSSFALLNSASFEFGENYGGGINHTFSLKVIPKVYSPTIVDGVREYEVNSLYSEARTMYKIANCTNVEIREGELYVKFVELAAPNQDRLAEAMADIILDDNGNRVRVMVQVAWGSFIETKVLDYVLGEYVRIGYPPNDVLAGEQINVGFRILGDSVNISSNFSTVIADLPAIVLDKPATFYVQDGEMKWDAVANAVGYKFFIAHDEIVIGANNLTYMQSCLTVHPDQIIASPQVVYIVPSNVTHISAVDLFEYVKEHSNVSDDIDLNMRVVMQAMGSQTMVSGGVSYFNSQYSSLDIVRYTAPKQVMTRQGVIVQTSAAMLFDISVTKTGGNTLMGRWSNNYTYFFPTAGEYTVKMRAVGDNISSFDSEWSKEVLMYKIDTPTNTYVQDGLLCIEAPNTFAHLLNSGNLSAEARLRAVVQNGAYNSVLIQVGENLEPFDQLTPDVNDADNLYTTYFGKYPNQSGQLQEDKLTGFLDILPSGVSTLKIRIVGNSYESSLLKQNILNSELYGEFQVQKLATPDNIKVENSVVSWSHVENNSGYYAVITGKASAQSGTTTYIVDIPQSASSATCVIDLLEKDDNGVRKFVEGEYSIFIRAKGGNTFLTSSPTTTVQFKVYKTPENLRVENGLITFDKVDEAELFTVEGVRIENSLKFSVDIALEDMIVTEEGKASFELPDTISLASGDKIDLTSGQYQIKLRSTGDGIQTINGEFTQEINTLKLNQVANVSSNKGKVTWDAVRNSVNQIVYTYKIEVKKDGYQENPENLYNSIIELTQADLSIEGRFSAEIPVDCLLLGNVYVSVKAVGNSYDINGSYSAAMQAVKLDPVGNLSISKNANTAGFLQWDFSQTGCLGFTLMISNAAYDGTIVGNDVLTTTYVDFPTEFKADDGQTYNLGSDEYNVQIKSVGQLLNGVHYLTTTSESIRVFKLAATSQIQILNGMLVWEQVDKSTTYEMRFTHSGGKVLGPNKIGGGYLSEIIDGASSNLRYFELDDSAFENGLYSSIEIRAIGGVDEDVNYVNSSYLKIENLWKLTPVADVQTTLDSENKVQISFLPITFTHPQTLETIKIGDYKLKIVNKSILKNNTSYVNLHFEQSQLDPAIRVTYQIDDTALSAGVYVVEIKALAPEGSLDIINSSYSESVGITKPQPPTNLTFNSKTKSFSWNKPDGFDSIELVYEIMYLIKTKNTWSTEVQTAIIESGTQYYPPVLGEYKIVIRSFVKTSGENTENNLKSEFVGANNMTYLTALKNNPSLTEYTFVQTYGVEGSNEGLFYGGEGTIENPYLIANETHFANMRFYSSSNFYFKLNSNIGSSTTMINSSRNLTGENISTDNLVLGSATNMFGANLDGGNYTIYINTFNSDVSSGAQGLFAYCQGATIKNLNIKIANNYTLSSTSNLKFGTLIGVADSVTLNNVTVESVIKIPSGTTGSSMNMYIGGVVGDATGNCFFENITYSGSITYTSTPATVTKINAYVGGIVAQMESTSINSFMLCTNNATLQGTLVGGIAGKANISMERCSNMGAITAFRSEMGAPYAGGLVGKYANASLSLSIDSCFNRGNVTAYTWTQNSTAYAGGFIAMLEESVSLNVLDAFNAGIVSIAGTTSSTVVSGWLIASSGSVIVNIENAYNFITDISLGGAKAIVGSYGAGKVNNIYFGDQVVQESSIANYLSSYFSVMHRFTSSNNVIYISRS